MSHLNEFETEMEDKEALLRALVRMGIARNQIEAHDHAQTILGYHGTEDHKVGHIIVRKQAARIPSDIGWELKNGKYIGHVDDFDYSHRNFIPNGGGPGSPLYNDNWNMKLLNFYNLEKAKMGYEEKGIDCVEDKDELGRLRLRAKFHDKTASKIKTRS